MRDQQSLKSACVNTQSDQSLCYALEYSMSVKLLTEHHLEFLSLKGGWTGLSKSTLVKMPHCWKSHVTAQLYMYPSQHTVSGPYLFVSKMLFKWCFTGRPMVAHFQMFIHLDPSWKFHICLNTLPTSVIC